MESRTRILDWLMEAPFSDPTHINAGADFSYEDWFSRGRSLPDSIDVLVEFLEREDPEHPSGNGMRAAYALGWIGDKRDAIVNALIKSLDSKDVVLQTEAASALGRQGSAAVVPLLERLLSNEKESIN